MSERRTAVYCFGNLLLKEDRLPLELMPQLQQEFPDIDFVAADSPDEIEEQEEINVIDTAEGVDRVTMITDLDSFCTNRTCSLHDFDLGMTLRLMQKRGKLKGAKILCIPMNYSKAKALTELKLLIRTQIG